MADAFLQIVFENLNSLIQREVGLLWGVDKEMEKLSSTLSTIRAVLEDAEEQQVKDKAIQNWLMKLKDAAYDIDNILDECMTEASQLQSEGHDSGLINKVPTSFLTCFNPENVLFRRKIGRMMREIRERLDEIADERMKFHLRVGAAVDRRVEAIDRRQTGSILVQSQVYGREEDRERIVECLVKDVSNCEDVSIYPIIGIGGLGKTTLAQLVYNDERVNRHFETRIWVCISDDFDVKRVIRAIIESACGNACEALDLEPLQRRLQEMLNGKKYLLVLDDVWNEDQDKWDGLKSVLACGSKGASIIITTRVEKVASIMGTVPLHRLSGLSEDDCWLLFRQRAFGNDVEERSNIVAIGKEIVKKCGGVPLAAKALGSLMRFKRVENEWLSVKDSEIWNLPQDENSILPALKLSYVNLPLVLRQCFAYCAIFPKDSVIVKEVIIDLWIANGFISFNGNLELEDIGNGMWNELYWRSFFQDVEEGFLGNIASFKMHDLMHDLAQSVVMDEGCIMEAEKSTNVSNRIRHVSLAGNSEQFLDTIRATTYKFESLRTLLWRPMQLSIGHSAKFTSELSSDLLKFDFIRVFVARGAKISKVSSSIGKLKHLRYLDLSWTNIRMLPGSIGSLCNLQTLKIEMCVDLQRLPKQMCHLSNLRHLDNKGCHSLTQMPPKFGQLTCLNRLGSFVVGERRGVQLGYLQVLNLRGQLNIEQLERVKNVKDAEDANLVGKLNLRDLSLRWGSDGESVLQGNAEQVLEALEPPATLQCLRIQGYTGTCFPLWMSNQVLENVVHLSLYQCKSCIELPPLGKLPSLKTLNISGMNCVEYIDNGSHGEAISSFPSLEELWIDDMPSLIKWSKVEGREQLYHLKRLSISKCPKLSWRYNEGFSSLISNLHSLTSLSFVRNEEVISFPHGMLRNLTALQELRLETLTKLEVLPTDLVSLTALKSLSIRECHELECLPEQGLRGLTSLQNLSINSCMKFKSLSEGLHYLTALEILRVVSCPELVDLPESIRHLNSLRHVYISGDMWQPLDGSENGRNVCSKLVVLPTALRDVSSLQVLEINGYSDLATLPEWLGTLTSLKSLTIGGCPKLTSLPASFQNLTKLQTLSIWGCPELQRRCEKETGEDWSLISHIPKLKIKMPTLLEAPRTNLCMRLKETSSRFLSSFTCT